MGVFDKFLDAIKLNDDYDDDDFLDDEFDDDFEEQRPRRKFFDKFQKTDDEDEYYDEPQPRSSAKSDKSAQKLNGKTVKTASSKITPMRTPKKGQSMEVCVIRPTGMDDTKEIADTLMSNCTVVLNLEGVDVDMAQRIIDFTSGCCYSLNGGIQMISGYIFILTPFNVDISGDFQDILTSALPSARTELKK
ncbi:MAG: cell division protein SepF [Lachnospiraceae bacterium]|jgi:cell division inhibitor SepF|nr:cell division protein SepF [Lachnospiraceae bacterium]MCI9098305.1 cell division protein SepF [Lachnospiraceae bacterium]MCI9356723.1 cell division protein SepF [Lachnospiraceae bacterium]